MASTPRPADPSGAVHAASPRAAQVSEAEAGQAAATNAPAQLPLFPLSDLPRAARARLPGRQVSAEVYRQLEETRP